MFRSFLFLLCVSTQAVLQECTPTPLSNCLCKSLKIRLLAGMFLRSNVVNAVGINFENLGSNPSPPAGQILLFPSGFSAIDVHGCVEFLHHLYKFLRSLPRRIVFFPAFRSSSLVAEETCFASILFKKIIL